jgi:hypothetical protein
MILLLDIRLLIDKKKLALGISIGTKVAHEMKMANTKITGNRFRNLNSDEVNQSVYELFIMDENYYIDKHKENGYEHIRIYSKNDKYLYVLLREGTYEEVLKSSDNKEWLSVHHLYAYGSINTWLIEKSKSRGIPLLGQMTLFDDPEIDLGRNSFIQKKAQEVMKNLDVDVSVVITYDIGYKGNVTSLRSRVLNPDIKEHPIHIEEWSQYLVGYEKEDELVTANVEPTYIDLNDEKHKQEITKLMLLKTKKDDNNNDNK